MFVNGPALAVTLWLLLFALVVLAGVLVAHLLWVVRLARGPGLTGRPAPMRALAVAAAFVTPVLSFYAVEIAAPWRRRAAGERLVLVAILTVALAALGAASEEARYVPGDRTAWHAAGTFLRLLRLLVIAQLLIFMILRVLSGGRRPVLVWSAFLIVAALLVFLLI
ncbi:hypothetical protein [Methylobacterium sp. B4]|uniref:hypothetical protein n=1 Tax=Methylobacterium sp. B4 TaxID=1938755 RepID=UPI000D761371|nr:hypothetical protein [Methylobacterium sp. B4]PXW54783.1 hypothetical protein BY998_12031 [Methylobacterium sp. B4]